MADPTVPDVTLTPPRLLQGQGGWMNRPSWMRRPPWERESPWDYASQLHLDPLPSWQVRPLELTTGLVGSGALSLLTPPWAPSAPLPLLSAPRAQAGAGVPGLSGLSLKLPGEPWQSLLRMPYDLWQHGSAHLTITLPFTLGPLHDMELTFYGGRDAIPDVVKPPEPRWPQPPIGPTPLDRSSYGGFIMWQGKLP